MTEERRNRARYILAMDRKFDGGSDVEDHRARQRRLESHQLLEEALDAIDAAVAVVARHAVDGAGGGRCSCRACLMREELTR